MRELRGRVALVTGASRGIGAAIAEALAAEGCHVALAARSQDAIEKRAKEIRQRYGVEALALPVDLGDATQIGPLIESVVTRLGRIDILVNNAGAGIYGDVASLRAADLRATFDVNFFAPVAAMAAAVPHMRSQGDGVIVNIGSIVGKMAQPLGGGYSASKYALHGASGAARAELKSDNIAVVLICPGLTDTEFAAHSRISVPGLEDMQGERHAPLRGVPTERVARRVVKAIRRREREVYITLFDRLVVLGAQLFPGLFEWGLLLATKIRRQRFAQSMQE
ncbi:MAG: SDR family NAD(P)-dependent oxidoreductase [Caldilineaceae bacterium]|nr:SDR family NAD(P)-dependent oxidoreductase [Caldilineaceae bacterium]HRJ41561.1 SDR family NAD(P)-dependent oxidoreductase [Caldilineaceae bacterium]